MNDRLSLVSESDLSHYERLGVSAQASQASLRQAFRRRSKALHPDTTTLPAAEAAKHFQQLKESYEFLSDPERRRLYDERLQPQRSPARSPQRPLMRGMASANAVRSREENGRHCCCWVWRCCSASSWGLESRVQGRAWQVSPEWLSDVSSASIEHSVESAFPEGAGGLALRPNAERIDGDPCRWALIHSDWAAEIRLEREDVVVIWRQPGADERRCSLPYGLSRADVTAAIQAGP